MIAVMHANADNARKLLRHTIPRIGAHTGTCQHGCDRALEHAILTAPDARDPALREQLSAIAGPRCFGGSNP